MRTMPRFLSAGLIVMCVFAFFSLVKAVRCCRERLGLSLQQMLGRLSAMRCFVSSMYCSRWETPEKRCIGDSILGGGRNFMRLYILDVVVGFGVT